jgi:NTE family protein
MFGAYQAGAWKVLADRFEPDLVVGASIGAINGWTIAGRCSPDNLIDRWLHLDDLSGYRFCLPRKLTGGIFNSEAIEGLIRDSHACHSPEIEYGLVLTDCLKLRPRIVRGPSVTWQHLAASAAIPLLFNQHRLDGRMYTDGGLLNALPLWAAAEMGAERIVAVNALPLPPNRLIHHFFKLLRAVTPALPKMSQSIEVIQIAPSGSLGSAKDALYWTRENATRWIDQGRAHAAGVCEHITLKEREVQV